MGEDDLTPPDPIAAPAARRRARERLTGWLSEIFTGPHMVALAKRVVPWMLTLLAASAQHWAGKAETDKAIDVSYKTNAPVIKVHARELDDIKKGMAELADSVHVLQKLALSGQPGFNTVGVPMKVVAVAVGQRKRVHVVVPPADPALVKTLQASEAKNQKLQVRLEAKVPPSPSVPPTLPAEAPPVPPAPPAIAPLKPPAQEWPPPVPTAQPQPGAPTP